MAHRGMCMQKPPWVCRCMEQGAQAKKEAKSGVGCRKEDGPPPHPKEDLTWADSFVEISLWKGEKWEGGRIVKEWVTERGGLQLLRRDLLPPPPREEQELPAGRFTVGGGSSPASKQDNNDSRSERAQRQTRWHPPRTQRVGDMTVQGSIPPKTPRTQSGHWGEPEITQSQPCPNSISLAKRGEETC